MREGTLSSRHKEGSYGYLNKTQALFERRQRNDAGRQLIISADLRLTCQRAHSGSSVKNEVARADRKWRNSEEVLHALGRDN